MRTKTVSLDGADFAISPLTMSQVEGFVGILNDPTADKMKVQREVVATGMNNAAGTLEWGEARVYNEIDFVTFRLLTEQVCAFSGIEFGPLPEGEVKAVSEMTSRSSAAA
jgi:hypothetical protein